MDDLFQLRHLDVINDDELEEALLIELGEPRESGYLRSNRYSRIDLNSFTELEFQQKFRFRKEDFSELFHLLGLPETIKLRNRYCTTGMEGLAILLRRLAYPNRWCDLESLFGLSPSFMSAISTHVMQQIIEKKGHLLELSHAAWITQQRLEFYADAVSDAGAPLKNCWGFIDGTCRAICRPTVNQEDYYSGHKRMHCLKYLDILCPDGMIACLVGPYRGRRHDSGILRESGLYAEIEQFSTFGDKKFLIYGDSGFPLREFLLTPFPNNNLNGSQQSFNKGMSAVRQAVEWGFGKVVNEFAFLDFKKNQKLLHQEVAKIYKTAVILTNCHSCLYGNQTATYFNAEPPSLSEYLM